MYVHGGLLDTIISVFVINLEDFGDSTDLVDDLGESPLERERGVIEHHHQGCHRYQYTEFCIGNQHFGPKRGYFQYFRGFTRYFIGIF